MLNILPTQLTLELKKFEKTTTTLLTDPAPQVGLTPKEVVWKRNKTTLYRYRPHDEKKYRTPLLMIYALINKSYILDLTPGNSLVEYLCDLGYDVYLLDWGTFGLEDRYLKLDHFILDYIPRAVKKVLQTSKADEVSLLGYCMGGTMTSIFASLHPELPIRNVVFLTTPFDFSNAGLFSNWLNPKYFNVNKLVDTLGNIPPEMIDAGNKMLKPLVNTVGPVKSLYERSQNEDFVKSWQLMQHWVADGIPFPGESFRQWIRDFYQDNKLIKGELTIRGRQVDLKNINANILSIAGVSDHIAQPCQVKPAMDLFSVADKTYAEMPTGHVSIVYGKNSLKHTYPTISSWLHTRSN